jgi:hypothetical protein
MVSCTFHTLIPNFLASNLINQSHRGEHFSTLSKLYGLISRIRKFQMLYANISLDCSVG